MIRSETADWTTPVFHHLQFALWAYVSLRIPCIPLHRALLSALTHDRQQIIHLKSNVKHACCDCKAMQPRPAGIATGEPTCDDTALPSLQLVHDAAAMGDTSSMHPQLPTVKGVLTCVIGRGCGVASTCVPQRGQIPPSLGVQGTLAHQVWPLRLLQQ